MSKPGTTFNVCYNVHLDDSFGQVDVESPSWSKAMSRASAMPEDEDCLEVHKDGSTTIHNRWTTFEFDEPVSDMYEAADRIRDEWQEQIAPNSPVKIEIYCVERAEVHEKIVLELIKHGIEASDSDEEWTDSDEQRLRELEELHDLHQWDQSVLFNDDIEMPEEGFRDFRRFKGKPVYNS